MIYDILTWFGRSGHDYDDLMLNWELRQTFNPELCRATMLEF